MRSKKIRNLSKSTQKGLDRGLEKLGKNSGIANEFIQEPIPILERASSETTSVGSNNSFIIQGRDRPGNLFSGFGGRGATQAGRIDLIAGISSALNKNENDIVNPNFALDASRLYISQLASVDRYLGLAETPRQAPDGRSTIALKSDTIRIHARQDIKIVTGRARFEGMGKDGELLSGGGKNEIPGTISFIAGNYTEDEAALELNMLSSLKNKKKLLNSKLQPIPKGNNLISFLEEMLEAVVELSTMVSTNSKMIQRMDFDILKHTHPVAASPVPPYTPLALPPIPIPNVNTPGYTASPRIQTKLTSNRLSSEIFNKSTKLMKLNYLNPLGTRYISSRFVYTT